MRTATKQQDAETDWRYVNDCLPSTVANVFNATASRHASYFGVLLSLHTVTRLHLSSPAFSVALEVSYLINKVSLVVDRNLNNFDIFKFCTTHRIS